MIDNYDIGDAIYHELLPHFTMTVLDTGPCEVDPVRPEPHLAYKIIDFEGNEDWLCAYDVRRA
ncbi:hypothetical protein [Streptomyces klenkii]|uniref:hypothetical protein n=1 Tax=Streptomyces klenkii TaxID=1420899 RepID=UPI00344278B4